MPVIDFPVSTAPGLNPGESGGRLINAFAEPQGKGARSPVILRRTPGLAKAFTAGTDTWRGDVIVGSQLYVANGDKVYLVTKSAGLYTVSALTGTLPGEGRVFMARNMNATPQILIVHSEGMSRIAAGAVSDFTDPDLPAANDICFLDSYFFVGIEIGKVFASAVNDVTFSGVDKATAESKPDGLLRVVPNGRDLVMLGTSSIEFWSNTANATGFPFSRAAAKSVGLWGRYAIAGFQDGYTDQITFVASDNTVKRLNGYEPERISSPDLEKLIAAVADRDSIEASVYVSRGRPVFVLSSDDWTWEYDGQWNERRSIGADRWRAHGGILAFDEWLVFDTTTNDVYRIDPTYAREGSAQIPWEVRSVQMHNFPGRNFIKQLAFDFLVGVGIDAGVTPIETNPTVKISWSIDGGRTFKTPLIRSLGTQGELRKVECRPRQLTKRFGVQIKLEISDPVEIGLMGGAINPDPRAA